MSINGDWLKKTEIPDTETRITQAYFIQNKINRELASIIHRERDGPIAALRDSWIAAEGRIPAGISPLLQVALSTSSVKDICTRIGWMNRYGIKAPLDIYVQGDPRNRQRCRIFIEEGEPSIGVAEYWQDPEYVGHRRAYATYIKRLATCVGIPELLGGYSAEREFTSVFPTVTNRKQRLNTLTWSELNREFRDIQWTDMFLAWGLTREQLPDLVYIVTSSAFLHHLQKRIVSWSIKRWQSWFALIITHWTAGVSPRGPLRTAWYDYKFRYLQGAQADESDAEMRNVAIRHFMPNILGKLWVRDHCDPKVRHTVTAMVNQIKAAAATCLRRSTWMAASTKAAAIRKLQTMDIEVCWPEADTWTASEVPCGLSNTDLLANRMAIAKIATDTNLTLLAKGDCRHPTGTGWEKPVFEVNAYYYPDENRFLLPAAILRPPFYDPAKSLIWNYGAIGATIGHEFCHAFDSDGRTFDEKGNKRDWWTERDTREYKRKARAVVRLFETEPYRGRDVDGVLTLVENIADIGGLEFSLEALKTTLGRPLTKADAREFFTSYAVSWRSKDRLKRAAELLVSDQHAPPMLRVNHVVRQFKEWYEAFDVGPDSAGWIAPEDRIRFFRD
jgi:predicted metalloendopeptidase